MTGDVGLLGSVACRCGGPGNRPVLRLGEMGEQVVDEIDENTSDGFHTFKELYDQRAVLTAALFQYLQQHHVRTWRSTLHEDGTMFNGFFIVGADLDTGPVTFHHSLEHWRLFHATTTLATAPPFDGHTPADVMRHLKDWILW